MAHHRRLARSRSRAMGAASVAALCLWVGLAHAHAAASEDEERREAQWAARRARGEMAPERATGQRGQVSIQEENGRANDRAET
jgi:hypothetical protein